MRVWKNQSSDGVLRTEGRGGGVVMAPTPSIHNSVFIRSQGGGGWEVPDKMSLLPSVAGVE